MEGITRNPDYVDMGPDDGLGGDFTIEAWVNVAQHHWYSRIVDFGNGVWNNNVVFGFLADTGVIFLHSYDGGSRTEVLGPVVPTGEWVHLAAVNDGLGNVYLYVNGELVASGSGQLVIPRVLRTTNYIGKSNWPDWYFYGQMREIRIWDVARTQGEIQGAMSGPLTGTEPGLEKYFRGDEGTGSVLHDLATPERDGTIYGSLWLNAPAEVTAAEDSAGVGLTGLRVWDIDAGEGQVRASIGAGHGVVVVSTTVSGGVSAGDVEGNGTSGVVVTGTLSALNATLGAGGLEYAPGLNYNGADGVVLSIDDKGNSGSGGAQAGGLIISVTVTPVNDPPVAASDVFSVAAGGVLTVPVAGVLANDVDVDGDLPSALLVMGVAHGELALNQDGSFVYTPTAGYFGADTFTYKANDLLLDSNEVTVTIDVVPDNLPPVAVGDNYSAPEDSVLSVGPPGVLANDSDADGDVIVVVLVTPTVNGLLWLGMDGSFEYTPTLGYAGSDSFYYRAFDGELESAEVEVSLTVAVLNEAPVIESGDQALSLLGGSGDYVVLPDAGFAGDFTIEGWVNVGEVRSWSRVVEFGSGPNWQSNVILGFLSDTNRPMLLTDVDGSESLVAGTYPLPVGEWAHVAAVNDGLGTVSIYINGSLAGTGASLGASSAARTENYIGKSSWPDPMFKGMIRDLRVWDVARTQGEIQAGMDAVLSGGEAGLVMLYRANEGMGTVLHDGVSGKDGLIEGSAWVALSPLPGQYTVTEGSQVVVSGVGVWDVDAGNGQVTASFGVQHGALAISTTLGGGVEAGEVVGNGGATVVVTSTLTKLDVTLAGNGLSYAPASGYTGEDVLTMTVNDNGNTGAGGPRTVSWTVGISVTAGLANQAPVIGSSLSALRFGGVSSDYVVLPDPGLGGGFTIEGWVNVEVFENWPRVVEFGSGADWQSNIILGFWDGTGQPMLITDNGGAQSEVVAGESLVLGRWAHLAGVNDGLGNAYLYINGELVASASGQNVAPAVPRTSNYLAKSNWSSDGYFNGQLRDVRVWSVARSQAQIQAAMNAELSGSEPGLAMYYKMEEGMGAVLHDSGGVAQDGMIAGSSWESVPVSEVALSTARNQAVALRGIEVSDPDGGVEEATLSMGVGHGTVEVSGTVPDGVTGGGIWGNESASVVVTGTLSELNVTLGSGGVRYVPAMGYTGLDRLEMVLNDNSGGLGGPMTVSVDISVTVVGVNEAPVAVNDSYTTYGVLAVGAPGVLGNDGDVDGDVLSAVLVTGTQHGEVSLSGDGGFVYTPTSGYFGFDSFAYSASDGHLYSAATTVTITVLGMNQPPLVVPRHNALQLNGSATDWVDLPDPGLNGGFTIEAWVNVAEVRSWSRIVEFGSGPDWQTNIILGFFSDTNRPLLLTDAWGVQNLVAGSDPLPVGSWAHVAAVNDGLGNVSIYVNGILAGSGGGQNAAVNAPRTRNYIGKSNWDSDPYFAGGIRDLRVWNLARSQPELQAAMNSPLTGAEVGLATYYPADEGWGGSLHDPAHPNDATVHGSTWVNSQLLPAEYSVLEDTMTTLGGFGIGDVDAGSGAASLSVAVLHGTLVVSTTIPNGITLPQLAGNGTGNVEITGTLKQLNSTLRNGGLAYVPALHYTGPDTLSLLVNDNGNSGAGGPLTASWSTPITITASNTPPTISPIPSQTTDEGVPVGPIDVEVGDAQTPADSLLLSASSSDTQIVPNSNIALGGEGISRTLTVTPAVGYAGSVTITVTVEDAVGATADTAFALTVRGVPVVTWTAPAAIVYGTPLTGVQLNATASVEGSFIYTPSLGAILNAGAAQALVATFVPAGAELYGAMTVSNTIDVLKATPIVTWPAPADIEYGVPLGPVELSATASVTGTFVYTPAAGTILPVGNGQELETSFVPGDFANYMEVLASQQITVTKAPLTVVADDQSRAYGEGNPVLSGAISGLRNGDAITPTFSTTATVFSEAGSYAIIPAVIDSIPPALGNYDLALVSGTLTVTQAALTVTASDAIRTYGDPNPSLTGTVSGLRNGDVITATFATTTGVLTPAGVYPIVAGAVDSVPPKLPNYALSLFDGSLIVTKAPLTITADNAARLYGEANPPETGVISGTKNADPITAQYSTTATITSAAGSYAIVPTAVGGQPSTLDNYLLTLVPGILTVGKAPLGIAADDKSRAYGDPNPLFSGSITGLRNGDSISASFTVTAGTSSNVGLYPIVPAPVDSVPPRLANYEVVLANGTLTITQVPLTITADSKVRLYGDPNPTFTGVISGTRNGDPITASYATAAASSSPAGSYTIVPSAVDSVPPKLLNYTVNLITGTLTVNKTPLSIITDNKNRVYGDANPTFTGIISGTKNGDPLSASYSTTATVSGGAGTYPITPVAVDSVPSKLGNYDVTLISGSLLVTRAPLTITADNKTKTSGSPNPPLTGVISGVKNLDAIAATFSTTATTSSPPGAYPIVPAAVDAVPPKLGNYDLTLVNGTLTVLGGGSSVITITRAMPNPAAVSQSVAISFTVSSVPPGGSLTGNVTVSGGSNSCTAPAIAGYCALTFSAAGFYTLTATYADDPSYNGSTSSGYALVVYDPNAGKVEGEGWYRSPAGAYLPKPSLSAKMKHDFEVWYVKGGSIPQGEVELKLDGVIDFESTSLDWLVISGHNFFIQGTGEVEGRQGSYRFWYVGAGADTDHETARARIWKKSNGQLLYDSQPGDPVWAFPEVPLGGGYFTIHDDHGGSSGVDE